MSPTVTLYIVLKGAALAATAAVVSAIEGIVLTFSDALIPPVLPSVCTLSVLVGVALGMWSTAIRRKIAAGDR
jgi:hypothetical protein